MLQERVQVECYSGYRANERPIAFVHRGVHYEVAEVVDRWYQGDLRPSEPAVDYYKVRTRDGQTHLLRYNALFDVWTIVLPEPDDS